MNSNPTRLAFARALRLLRRYQPRLRGYTSAAHRFLVRHNAEHMVWHQLRLANFDLRK